MEKRNAAAGKEAMKVKLKRTVLALLTLSMLFTSGCWDMIEIEERAIIGIIEIDLVDEKEGTQDNKETSPYCEDKPDRIRVTFGVQNPSKVLEGGEGAAVPVTVEAANLADAMEMLGGRISRMPFYGQARLLILSDRLIANREIFKEVVDEFERKAVLNHLMRIAAFQGDPLDIQNVEVKLENLYTTAIFGIMKNASVLSNTVSMTLRDLLTDLRNNDGNTAIPLLEIKPDNDKAFAIDKLLLVNNYKSLGVLDSKYIKSYKMINGTFKYGRKLIDYNGIVVPYYIYSSDRKFELEDNDDGLSFKVKFTLEGDIEQFKFEKTIFDNNVIDDLEKSIESFTEAELDNATKYFQRDIGYDYLGFKEYLNKYHYKVFKKYEDNWEDAFRNAKIKYEVEAYVRRIGVSKE